MSEMEIVQCASCDGYGWITDEFEGATDDCDWCGGTGYVYRDENGVDHRIPFCGMADCRRGEAIACISAPARSVAAACGRRLLHCRGAVL